MSVITSVSRSSSDLETTQWRKDGSPFEAAIWTAPLRDRQNISGVLITIADVSDQKRLEEQFRSGGHAVAQGRLAVRSGYLDRSAARSAKHFRRPDHDRGCQ